MNWLSQTIAVTAVTLRSISQRLGSSIVAIIGIAGVVIVFTAVLSIAEGFRKAMQGTGDPQTVIVLRSGSDTEMTSGVGGEEARLIAETPGIEQGPDGAHASPELFVIVGHPLKRSGTDANVPLRGVTPAALAVRPTLKIIEGRMFQPGTNEIVVGKRRVASVRRADGRHRRALGRQSRGRSSACSTPAAASPSPRSGATRRCCSQPIVAGTRISRSTSGWRQSTASRRSRMR